MALRQVAFAAVRSRPAGLVVRAAFGHAERLLPLERLANGTKVTLYRHPKPAYGSKHLLMVPSVGIRDLFALSSPRHRELRAELWRRSTQWRADVGTPWMTVNAGPRQDVYQVHFHLTDIAPPELVPVRQLSDEWETALRTLTSYPELSDWMRQGFALMSGPDGSVHVMVEQLAT